MSVQTKTIAIPGSSEPRLERSHRGHPCARTARVDVPRALPRPSFFGPWGTISRKLRVLFSRALSNGLQRLPGARRNVVIPLLPGGGPLGDAAR